jgi:hypothetical protein
MYAIIQFFYLTIFAVPLSWFFWLVGIPRNLSMKFPIEDQIIYLPIYSLSLLVMFFILLFYPYCIGYLLGENSPSKNATQEVKDSVQGKVWKSFIACIIGPMITLALSLLAPMLLVPIDQAGLANLIIAAISSPNLGV